MATAGPREEQTSQAEQTRAREVCNEVLLIGRLAGPPTSRTLPSGDELISWRLVVDRLHRDVRASAGVRQPTVDTIDCVALRAGVRRLAGRWEAGDVLEIRGALRRRFWRGAQGTASRCEVEVIHAKKVARPRQ
jgi:single-strand DNA-binding protein